MKKSFIFLSLFVGVLLLAGAGCVNNNDSMNDNNMVEDNFNNEMQDSNNNMEEIKNTDDDSMTEENKTDDETMMKSDGVVKTFEISGKNFEFSPKEIRVNKGDQVTINFISSAGFHDWKLDEFNAATSQVQTGQKSSVTFVADKEGVFEYYCSVGSHRQLGMVGKLIVE